MSVINTNVNAIIAQNAGVKNERMQTTAMQRLSTGNRINTASDDAAGLAISTKMTSQIRGLDQAVRNANDGISLIQTAEGALTEVNNMLQRMRELAIQSASDTNTTSDRTSLNAEFVALRDEINRIGNNTQFNGMNVLDGSFAGNGVGNEGKFIFQVGANAAQTIDITLGDYRTTGATSATLLGSSYSSIGGGEQTSTLNTTGLSLASGATLQIKLTVDGTETQITYTAGSDITNSAGNELATALKTGLLSDVQSVLGSTAALNVNASGNLEITGAANQQFTLALGDAAASTTLGGTSYLSSAQSDTVTLAQNQAYAVGDTVSIDVGGSTYSYTVATAIDSASDSGTTLAGRITSDAAFTTWLAAEGVSVDSTANNTLVLTGANNARFTTTASLTTATAGDLSAIATSSITTQSGANDSVTALDTAISTVSGGRATMGATINRLNYAADNLMATSANVSASRSRIQDTDYSQATTELARTQIIQQASTAMLAQANQSAQSVLSLLK